MPITQAICTRCGGILAIESDNEKSLCPFCEKEFDTKKAIKRFKRTQKRNEAEKAALQDKKSAEYKKPEDFEIEDGVLKAVHIDDKEIIVPDSVKIIGENAFSNLGAVSVTLPDSVIEIGKNAFLDCDELKKINIPKKVLKIDTFAFAGCEELEEIILPDGLEYIGCYAFLGCASLRSLVIPDSVEKIGESYNRGSSFNGCNRLKELSVPCSLPDFHKISVGCCVDTLRVTKGTNGKMPYCDETYIHSWFAGGCKNLVIASGVKSIAKYAFSHQMSLESVELPSSVKMIEEYAFFGCQHLSSVSIPLSLKKIEEHAFDECASIPKDDMLKIKAKTVSKKENENEEPEYCPLCGAKLKDGKDSKEKKKDKEKKRKKDKDK